MRLFIICNDPLLGCETTCTINQISRIVIRCIWHLYYAPWNHTRKKGFYTNLCCTNTYTFYHIVVISNSNRMICVKESHVSIIYTTESNTISGGSQLSTCGGVEMPFLMIKVFGEECSVSLLLNKIPCGRMSCFVLFILLYLSSAMQIMQYIPLHYIYKYFILDYQYS